MRILHTSDWHLGRSFHGEDMLTAQAAFVDHLLDVVDRERVDLVAVAGDVYDRALPPVDAVSLAQEAFERLAASRARVLVTSGNHDSARRLGFSSRLIDRAGVHLRTDPARVAEPILIDDEHGTVACYGIPFLEPDLVRGPWELDQRSHQAAVSEAMRRIRADLDPRGCRSVVLAHVFAAGGVPSDSERDISVGGVQVVGLDTFAGPDYVALGHLHGRHTLTDRVRYSGSPLAYSFSEARHTKGSWLVDLDAEGLASVEFVPSPVPRPLALLRGRIEDLLNAPEHAAAESAWVQATLTDAPRPLRAWDRLRSRFPGLRSLRFEPEGLLEETTSRVRPGVRRTDHEMALDFVSAVRDAPATDAEAGLLRLALDCCPVDPEQDRLPSASQPREVAR